MKRIAFLFSLMALMVGCNDKNERADSLGYAPDTIKLSTEELLFDNTTSVQEVMTKGDQWIMDEDVYVDGKRIDADDPTLKIEWGFIEKIDIKTPLRIEGEWFTITRDVKQIRVEVKANTASKERALILYLWDRNYRGHLKIKQEGRKAVPA